jgi:hypothetical protein
VLIAAGGCFALPAASDTDLLLVERLGPADDQAAPDATDFDLSSPEANDFDANDMAAESDSSADTPLSRQVKRIGLGVSPIILFVLLVWGLSRLPFVH